MPKPLQPNYAIVHDTAIIKRQLALYKENTEKYNSELTKVHILHTKIWTDFIDINNFVMSHIAIAIMANAPIWANVIGKLDNIKDSINLFRKYYTKYYRLQ